MNIFLARQAIYNVNKEIIAYEILYRNSYDNKFLGLIEEDKATMKVISNISAIGLEKITYGKKAFINFPKGCITSGIGDILSKENLVIEILESVEATDYIKEKLRDLKKKRYIIALDDVSIDSNYKDFEDIIDIYKIDFLATTYMERREILKNIKALNKNYKLLAEKIESDKDFEEAKKIGYWYYQGYYFSEPIVLKEKDIEPRDFSCFRFLQEIEKENVEIEKLEEIIKGDVALSLKLMRFLNSSVFNFTQEIKSINQAIMLLGIKELKRWILLVSVSEFQSYEKENVVNISLIRGKFCELIVEKISRANKSEAFILGLFSCLDVLIEKEMVEIVSDMPVSEGIKEALLGNGDTIFTNTLNLVKVYEDLNVEKIDELCEKLSLNKKILTNLYIDSIEWTSEIIKNC